MKVKPQFPPSVVYGMHIATLLEAIVSILVKILITLPSSRTAEEIITVKNYKTLFSNPQADKFTDEEVQGQ